MKTSKIKKIISGTVSALMVASSIPFVASAADQQTRGNVGGYDYEMWNQNGQGQASMNPGAGSFTCSWSNIENFLARMGKNFDSQKKNYKAFGNIVLTYDVEYTPRGNSYMCVYGWTRNPLMEYYIVEGWGDWRPPGNDGERKGNVTLNGNTYEIAKTMRYNQPSLDGTSTFPQYWSIRTTSGSANNQTNYMKGTIDVSKHFDAWSQAGLDMSGTLYEVSLNIEGYRSNGSANVKSVTVTTNATDDQMGQQTGGGQGGAGGFDMSQFGGQGGAGGFDMSQFGGQGSNSETQKQNMENISMSSDVIRIMPAGDSITYGMGDTGGYRKYLDYFLKEKGYTNFDFVGPEGSNSASFKYNGNSVTYDDNHAGYSGYTIIKQQGGYGGGLYDVLKETDAVKKTQPNIILLIIGTNDMNYNHTESELEKDLHTLLDFMIADMPSDGMIFLSTIPELGGGMFMGGGDKTAQVASYNSLVKKVANEYNSNGKQVTFADIHGCLNGTADLGDGVHPNAVGYEKMGKYWADVVDEYLKSSKPAVTTTTTAATTTTTTTTTSSKSEATSATTSAQLKVTMTGDTNCDGQLDMGDAVLIMQALANPNKYGEDGSAENHLTAQGKVNGDMDGDGLTVGDAQKIQKKLLGLD